MSSSLVHILCKYFSEVNIENVCRCTLCREIMHVYNIHILVGPYFLFIYLFIFVLSLWKFSE